MGRCSRPMSRSPERRRVLGVQGDENSARKWKVAWKVGTPWHERPTTSRNHLVQWWGRQQMETRLHAVSSFQGWWSQPAPEEDSVGEHQRDPGVARVDRVLPTSHKPGRAVCMSVLRLAPATEQPVLYRSRAVSFKPCRIRQRLGERTYETIQIVNNEPGHSFTAWTTI